ncbi:hypothetical protein PR048_027896 [Dryococelus australis]|uniref:Uncharacterized protein n=1 Tax=Dryococelus australis TaxID=614101 RepID=A0ABQ9GHS4_9NEOP|nr:hypothetical protein PR048_027896 [Dryococelus australis]
MSQGIDGWTSNVWCRYGVCQAATKYEAEEYPGSRTLSGASEKLEVTARMVYTHWSNLLSGTITCCRTRMVRRNPKANTVGQIDFEARARRNTYSRPVDTRDSPATAAAANSLDNTHTALVAPSNSELRPLQGHLVCTRAIRRLRDYVGIWPPTCLFTSAHCSLLANLGRTMRGLEIFVLLVSRCDSRTGVCQLEDSRTKKFTVFALFWGKQWQRGEVGRWLESQTCYGTGAAVAERLVCSPPTKTNRVQSPAGSPDFRVRGLCRTMPLAGGFYRGSPDSPALSFRRCSIPQSPSSALKTSLLRAAQISLLTHGKVVVQREAEWRKETHTRSRNEGAVDPAGALGPPDKVVRYTTCRDPDLPGVSDDIPGSRGRHTVSCSSGAH